MSLGKQVFCLLLLANLRLTVSFFYCYLFLLLLIVYCLFFLDHSMSSSVGAGSGYVSPKFSGARRSSFSSMPLLSLQPTLLTPPIGSRVQVMSFISDTLRRYLLKLIKSEFMLAWKTHS